MNKKLVLISIVLLFSTNNNLFSESSRQRSQSVDKQKNKAYITIEENGKEVTYTQEEWQKKQDDKKQK